MLNPCRNHHCMLNSGLVLLQKLTRLAYLYLGDNELTAVPHLPESLYVVHLHVSSSVIYFEKTNKKKTAEEMKFVFCLEVVAKVVFLN